MATTVLVADSSGWAQMPTLFYWMLPMHYFRQGPHDGLCGFYAVLNAIRFMQCAQRDGLIDDHAFFNDGVECLARLPGCDIRILKNDPAIGGIDPFQIRDLCNGLMERLSLPLFVELALSGDRLPFARRYAKALQTGVRFAFVVPYRDGSHWVAVLPHDEFAYRLVDQGAALVCPVRKGTGPKLATDGIITLRQVPTI